MKIRLLIVVFVLIGAGAHGQDARFEFHSPFGSDGTNWPGLSTEDRNVQVLDEIWGFYITARRALDRPLPRAQPGGYSQQELDRSLTILRYGHLLDTMSQLRAFSDQNEGYLDEVQKNEMTRIDQALRSLNLSYHPNGGQGMVDFCAKLGADQIRQDLLPVLRNDDGSPRAIPAKQLGYHGRVTEIQPKRLLSQSTQI